MICSVLCEIRSTNNMPPNNTISDHNIAVKAHFVTPSQSEMQSEEIILVARRVMIPHIKMALHLVFISFLHDNYREFPHSGQNFLLPSITELHLGQRFTKAAPHSGQNLTPLLISAPHFGQI